MLKGKLVRTGCAVALAVGLVPVAAWAGAEAGDAPSEVASLQDAIDDKEADNNSDDSAQNKDPEKTTTTSSADVPAEGDAENVSNEKDTVTEKSVRAQATDPAYDKVKVFTSGAYTMMENSIVELFGADFFVMDTDGMEFFESHNIFDYCTITSSDTTVADIEQDAANGISGITVNSKKAGETTITLTLKDRDPLACTLTVVAPSDSGNEGSGTDGDVESPTAAYEDAEITSPGIMSMEPGESTTLTSPDGVPFKANDAARAFFEEHLFSDYLVSVVSSDPSVVAVSRNDGADYWAMSASLEAKKPGDATITITLKDKAPVSCKIKVRAAGEEVIYADVEVTSSGSMSMWPGDGMPLTSPYNEPFMFNDAAGEFFDKHPFDDYLVSVVSSDPSVVAVTQDSNEEYWLNMFFLEAMKPGTATVTLTLKDKAPVSCTITVKSASDADLSKLKFQQKNITLKAGASSWTAAYAFQWVGEDAMNAVGNMYAFSSSDDSILDCRASQGSCITALRPGVVTIGLYFFNRETEEYTLTDTATVTVTSPDVLAGSNASSDINGDIMGSNDEICSIVKDYDLSLNVKVQDPASMKGGEKKAYLILKDIFSEKNDRMIPVEISLVDRNGEPFDKRAFAGEELPYTVRLKLEGELAELDPETIMVYYLGEDGRPVNVTSWVEGGYLYIMTTHFSPYTITGKVKGADTSSTVQVGNKNPGDSKKQTVTATATSALPQAGDDATGIIPAVALSAAAAGAALYLTRRRTASER